MYREFPGFDDGRGHQGDGSIDSARELAGLAAIGKIKIAAGSVTIVRANASLDGARPADGDFIYEGDVIETGADGLVGIVFIDGTTFHLYANSRIVIDQFSFGGDVSSCSARLQATKGKFGLLAGKIAAAGRFAIDTPLSKIQSVVPSAGVASLGFMFLLCLIEDVRAGSESETLWLVDGGTITYKDFEHGVFELVTKDGQHIIVDDPGQTIVLHPTGSGVGIDHIPNDRAEIVALQDVYQRAYATFVQGLQDPFLQQLIKTSSEVGSGTLFNNNYNPFSGTQASLNTQTYTPPPSSVSILNTVVLPPVVPGGVTIGATFTARLPVSNAQTAPVYLGPSNGSHTNNIFLNLTLPSNEVLTSVAISGLPAGETITSGTGKVYSGGGTITILGADFYSGLTLSNFAGTAAVLTIAATVFGAGGARLTVTTLALTIDAPIVGQPAAVHWVGPSGGDWSTAGNWSTGVVPIPHQDVFLDKVGTVVSSGTVNISSLAVSAGVTLNITGGSFAIPTSTTGKPLSNAGVISIGTGATMTVGDAGFAGAVVNSDTLQLSGGTLNFVNVAVDNTAATLQVDTASVLNLNVVSIDGGTLNNSGSIVSTGVGSLTDVAIANTGGTLTIDGSATVELDGTTISGGTITDNGIIHVTGSSTIDGGASLNNGVVNVDSGVTLTLDNITITGTVIMPGSSTIDATGTFTVSVDASALADDDLLTLTGTADFTVSHLKGNLVATGLSGTLDVTTGSVAGLSIATGSTANTIHAEALGDNQVLTLTGDDAATVTLTNGDLDAAGSSGVLTVTVATDATASSNTIVTGSAAISIDDAGTGTLDDILVNALALADGATLTLTGTANFTVTDLAGDIAASNSGTLDVTTADALTIGIASSGGGTTSVNASALADDHTLTLTGTDNTTVTGLKGNLVATGLSGTLDVTTGSVAGLSIATGSTANTIHAEALGDNQVLTLTGDDAATVTLTNGDLDAAGSSGVLTVTVATDATASSNTIVTGSAAISIDDAGTGTLDDILVNALALADGATLTLTGTANFTVTDLAGDIAASNSGTLDVTTADALTIGIASSGGGTTSVNASALADDHTLTLTGTDNTTVTGLKGNLVATGLSGTLDVTTGSVAGLSIATGSTANTIHAEALGDNQVLTLTGDDAATVTLTNGDLDAAGSSGVLTVTVATDATASSNTIVTGSAAISIDDAGTGTLDDILVNALALADGATLTLTGTANFTVTDLAGDIAASNSGTLDVTTADALTIGIASSGGGTTSVNASALADDHTLTLTGTDNTTVTGLKGNLVATGLSGTLDVTTGSVAGLSIATGSTANTIHAEALGDNQVLTLTGDDAATVTLTNGDLDAAGSSGVLTVTVATDATASSNTIVTGSAAISIDDAGTGTLDDILVNALALADGATLTLTGTANFTVTDLAGDIAASNSGTLDVTTADALTIGIASSGGGTTSVNASALADDHTLTLTGTDNTTVTGLKGNLVATGLSGTLDVTTGSVAGLSIATGSTANTIHAEALGDNQVLTLTGDDAATVTLTNGDLDAAGSSGVLTVTVATDATASSNTIVTGSAAISIDDAGTGTLDDILVNALALADGATLTLTGTANFTVTDLAGDIAASNSGTLDVTTADALTIGIASSGGGTTSVNASALADDHTLTLTGTDNTTVTGLKGNLVATGLSGTLDVTTGSVAGLSIATGSTANTIHAEALGDNQVLTLTGDDAATVTLTNGDLDAAGSSGVLTVTVATDATASSNTIVTGSAAISIDDAGTGTLDDILVNALALADGATLTLTGTANFTVTDLAGDIAASNSGTLDVTTADALTIGIASSGGGTTSVNASALADDHTLTLTGTDNTTVTGLKGNLVATGLSGTLDVTTGSVAGLSIATGSTANTIHAEALGDNQVLTLTGSAAAAVFLIAGDLAAGAYTGNITVTGGAGSNMITTGSGDNSVTLSGAETGTIDLGSGTNSLQLADATNNLTASHIETITGGSGDDAITLGVAQASGNIDLKGGAADSLTLADGGNTLTVSNTETITGGSGDDAITLGVAQASGNIDLKGGAADSLTLADGGNSLTVSNTETITGGTGDDAITLGVAQASGNIDLKGGAADSLTLADGGNSLTVSNTETITGGTGDDAITLGVAQASGNIDLKGGTNTLNLAAGANTLSISNVDSVNGTINNDTLTLTSAVSGVTIDLGGGTDTLALVAGDNSLTAHGIEGITATALMAGQSLTLSGDGATAVTLDAGNLLAGSFTGNLTVTGGSGANTITTGSGDDDITAGGGADTLTGGTGVDTFNVDAGTSTITDLGAGGTDILVVATGAIANATAAAAFTASAATSNSGTASIAAAGFNIDLSAATGTAGYTLTNAGNATGVNLTGSSFADAITGGSGNDTIAGGGGDDTIFYTVGGGRDSVDGGTQTTADTLDVTGTAADEHFFIETPAEYTARTGLAYSGGGEIVLSEGSGIIVDAKGIEDITIHGGGGADTLTVSGSFTGTSLLTSTITFDGTAGDDTVDVSKLTSDHHVVFNGDGGTDTVILGIAPGDATYTPIKDANDTIIGVAITHNTPDGPRTDDYYGVTNFDFTTGTLSQTDTIDLPALNANGGSLAYTENDAPTAIDPAITVSDRDSTNLTGATVAIVGNFASGEDVLSFTPQNNITGNYDPVTGILTLSGSSSVANYQTALASVKYENSSEDPSTATRTVNFTVDDGAGPNHVSNTVTAQVSVTAVNDAPVTTPVTLAAIDEDSGPRVITQAELLSNATDVDTPFSSLSAVSLTIATGNGALVDNHDHTWTYTPALNDDTNVSFSYQVTDGFLPVNASATLDITPVNDAPVANADAGAIAEDATLTVSAANGVIQGGTGGSVADTDVDDATGTLVVSGVIAGTGAVTQGVGVGSSIAGAYGYLTLNADGSYSYVANNADSLAAGDIAVDTFTYTDKDPSNAASNSATLTITVTGVNDAAVLGSATVDLTETNAILSASGTLSISDVDSPAIFVAQSSVAGTYGTFTIGTDGAWSYTADSAHNEFVGGQTYTDTFPVVSADGTATSVVVNILGTNDAAVLGSATVNLTETNAILSTSGTLTISDVDSPAIFVAQSSVAGTYGTFTIGTNGAWSYTADSAHNEFVGGQTYTDTFPVASADGTATSVVVNILGTNDAPVITSNGAGPTASINAAENQTSVTTVTATDVDAGATQTYSIIGGADAALFDINSSTGALSFKTAPNFEAPTDAGGNNIYDVTVQASDGALTDTQSIAVTVTNVNEAPQFFASRQVNIVNPSFESTAVADNQTGSATGWTASGNAVFNPTASLFVGGEAAIPDGSQVGYLNGGSISQITSEALVAGSTYIVQASIGDRLDASFGGGNLQFWAGGALLASTPLPTPANGTWVTANLQYTIPAGLPQIGQFLEVRITSNGIQTLFDNVQLQVQTDAPATAAYSTAENSTAVTTVTASDVDANTTLTYSIFGGADAALFAINSSTGALSFKTAPNFEAPTDAGGNNIYDVTVQVSDGALTATQAIAVTVTDVNEAPVITSNGAGPTASIDAAENQTAVTTVTATDVDAGATQTYSIIGGADQAKFAIDPSTGVLTFVTAPNFEAPTDAGGNNVYDVTVQVSDGALADTQAIAVTVTNANDAPVLNAGATPVLAAVGQYSGAPSGAVGTLVSALVDIGGTLSNVTDADSGAVTGIALTATDTTHGAWWYSTNGGTNWTSVAAVSAAGALLLAADASTRLYFQPDAAFSGTVTNAITFRAWDQSSGNPGDRVAVSTNGNATAFSTATDVANIDVTAAPLPPSEFLLSSVNGTNGFKLSGANAGDAAGTSVASAGDVNGDGYIDLLVGAPNAPSHGAGSGMSYVVFGSASGIAANLNLSSLSGSNGFKILAEDASGADNNGFSVAAAGDVNHDGIADLIVGGPMPSNSNTTHGNAYVVFGDATLGADIDLKASGTINGTDVFSIQGPSHGSQAGYSVAAGDFNGDGYTDLIVGAPSSDPNGHTSSGATFIVFGKASGFASNLDVASIGSPTTAIRFDGTSGGDHSGFSVASAGDFNGDGKADVLIGAPNVNSNAGAVYLVFGKSITGGTPITNDLSALSGSDGFKINGEVSGNMAGTSVASAGDINGDGYADIIIGAPHAAGDVADSGAAYVLFGKATGFASSIDLSSLSATDGFKIKGIAAGDMAGISVASAGDVNGDGFSDLIIGAKGADANGVDSGASYVVYGKASGFGTVDLANLNGTDGFKITGAAANDASGASVASAGDLNHDGFSDLIIGATGATGSVANSGAAFVVYGQAPTHAVNLTGTNASQTLAGGDFNDTLNGGGGNDVLHGNGGADTFVFTPNFGKDTVADYTPGTDQFNIDHTLFVDVAALIAATTDSAAGAVITHDAAQTITLTGVTKADVIAHQGDFHFV